MLSRKESMADSAYYYIEKAYFLSKKCGSDSLKIDICNTIGALSFEQKKEYKKYLNEGIALAKSKHLSKKLYAQYDDFGYNELYLGNYDNALHWYFEELKYATNEKNYFIEAIVYHNIGKVYRDMEKYALEKEFYLKSLSIAQKINIPDIYDRDLDFSPSVLKSDLYLRLAQNTHKKSEANLFLAKADYFFKNAIKVSNNSIPKYRNSKFVMFRCRVLSQYDDYNALLIEAEKLNQFHVKEGVDYNSTTLVSYYYKMIAYKMLHNYTEAKKFLKLYIESAPNYTFKRCVNQDAIAIYKGTNELDKAVAFAVKEIKELENRNYKENSKTAEDYAAKYETAKKEIQIAKQNAVIQQEKYKKNGILFTLLVFVVGFLSLFQWYKNGQRRKKEAVEMALQKEQEYNLFRTQFLQNIAHEIRTPLTLMNGYLELANESETIENCKVNLNKAKHSSQSILNNANALLSLKKKDLNEIQLYSTTVLIAPFVEKIFYSFEALAQTKDIKLHYSTTVANDLSVKTDTDKVEKIINNLISNAIKYSPSVTSIDLIFTSDENQFQITVKDEGIGISETELPMIFERFYQSKTNLSTGGFGIGLALAKELAVLLGGDLTAFSVLGQGSEFCLSFPIVPTEISVSIEKTVEPISISKSKINLFPLTQKAKLLVVEDNPEMNTYYAEILSPFYDCHFAFDGMEGLKMAQKSNFDMVISDIMMPNVDGFEFKKLLKMIPSYTSIPFILISANGLSKDKIRGFEIGIDDYITKPFNKDELIARLQCLLQNAITRKAWIMEHPDLVTLPHDEASKKMLAKIETYILENLTEENIKASDLALKLGYSQRKLSHVVNEITGMTLVQFILEFRLREAYRMIQNKEYQTLTEIQYAVGINSPSYFNRTFKPRFGINPSELMK